MAEIPKIKFQLFFIRINKLACTKQEWNIHCKIFVYVKKKIVIIIYMQEKSEIIQNNDQWVSRNFNYFLVSRAIFQSWLGNEVVKGDKVKWKLMQDCTKRDQCKWLFTNLSYCFAT